MSSAMQEPRRHRITVEHYYRMAEAGLFQPDERVELIDGEIIDMPAMGVLHASALARLDDILTATVAGRAMVRSQLPLRLSEESEPQPDLALVKRRGDYYAERHPTAADVLLVIELADSTLRYDLEVKVPLYARHGVAETWIVDLANARLHSYRKPEDGRYAAAASTKLGMVELVSMPGV
ncbi:MAG TPA: Uma2 family endonuclease, partial [Gammaproteobacteria bacterium]|nr:Uma2 family endonuclease [Gammaproteobacteria bacterium]